MSQCKDWWLTEDDGQIYVCRKEGDLLMRDGIRYPILFVRAKSSVVDIIKIQFSNSGKSVREFNVKGFVWSQNEISRSFRYVSGAKEFVSIFERRQSTKNDELCLTTNPSNGSRKRPSESVPNLLPPSKQSNPASEDDDLDSFTLTDFEKIVDDSFVGFYVLPVKCLTEPRQKVLLRNVDRTFVDHLKQEMQRNKTQDVAPLVAIVQLRDGEEFSKSRREQYIYETIGGNNSRVALLELLAEGHTDDLFKYRLVSVYRHMPEEIVLKLAARHNQATQVHHSMTTQDLVTFCRARLLEMCSLKEGSPLPDRKPSKWRSTCAAILGYTDRQLEYSMIFTLSSLPPEGYAELLKVFSVFEECLLKGQKVSKAKRSQIPDCRGSHFRDLRSLDHCVTKTLLNKLSQGYISLREFSEKCKESKKFRTVQTSIMIQFGLKSWQEVEKRFGSLVSTENLQIYTKLDYSRKGIPPALLDFCSRIASKTDLNGTCKNGVSEKPNVFVRSGTFQAALLEFNELSLLTYDKIVKTIYCPSNEFQGFSLVVADLSEDKEMLLFDAVFNLMKVVNTQGRILQYTVVALCSTLEQTIQVQQSLDTFVTCSRESFWYSSSIKYSDKAAFLPAVVHPFVISYWSADGRMPDVRHINLFEIESPHGSKPRGLVQEMVQLFTKQGDWVLDCYSKTGVVAVTAFEANRNVIALERYGGNADAIRTSLAKVLSKGEADAANDDGQ